MHLRRIDSSTTSLWIDLFPVALTLIQCNPDQILRFAASDLDLHLLLNILLGVSRLKWVNKTFLSLSFICVIFISKGNLYRLYCV